jgi:hypothetical protein
VRFPAGAEATVILEHCESDLPELEAVDPRQAEGYAAAAGSPDP